ncbi:hypothetical protein HNP48_002271 [Acidovorax soli]|uniref:Uncharacterized protein n=1 Tax=Acidovorax soli TaxID=592050 RepID=A0A7X0U994_9BURK|nr:hypothetical protein [Acidovorax soli]MBB6559604.1 hypothetical protein [Acidovorax soli]
MSRLKRKPFKRKVPAWAKEPREERVYQMPSLPDPSAFRQPQPIVDGAAAIAKDNAVRSVAYQRAVASLPCIICGVPGYSQAAHGSKGKGTSRKACDMTLFPACCDRPGVRGCHLQLDQGALYSKDVRRALEPVWAADTQRRVYLMGMWPRKLPIPAAIAILKDSPV